MEERARDISNRATSNENASAVALSSIAISLKRIADALEKQGPLYDISKWDLTPRA